jgi:hypothetical protein
MRERWCNCIECGGVIRVVEYDHVHIPAGRYLIDGTGPLCEECYKMYESNESVQSGAIR